jgi:hypothetical protein
VAVVVVLLVGLSALAWSASSARAQEKPTRDWSHLRIVTYASGLTGFFDTKTGKLYVYDLQWNTCYFIRELTELGEPMKRIKDPISLLK